ncbi:dimethylarginine dimethylaminohydrolase family protein [Bacillus gobiensis]|uniref:dimethylarginine dimethylaminohydrolase family protein n=1 Tax=Bacillus gobiensis TaxID=1441095 RepID=UPI003D1F44BE
MASTIPLSDNQPFCYNEYDMLQKVVLCSPEHMSIKRIINETQKYYENENIQAEIAIKQHRELLAVLKKKGINVIVLPALERFPEQVFTRDIGFTIGSDIFIAEMATDIREGEQEALIEWLKTQGMQYRQITEAKIEGGDVIVHEDTVYVGISNRTEMAAVNQLQKMLPSYQVIPLPIHDEFLHLDCVFNIISPTEAIIYPDAFNKKEYDMLAERFDLLPVTEDEQFTLATNVLSLGNKQLISLPINKKTNQELISRGYTLIEVDISEIIKSGGSFRCCTLPIVRKQA